MKEVPWHIHWKNISKKLLLLADEKNNILHSIGQNAQRANVLSSTPSTIFFFFAFSSVASYKTNL